MHFENTSKNSKKSQKLSKYEKFLKNRTSKKTLKFIFTYPYQVSKTSNHKWNISPVIKNLPLIQLVRQTGPNTTVTSLIGY